jgi:membrane protease YdiL (CAAX protease family)
MSAHAEKLSARPHEWSAPLVIALGSATLVLRPVSYVSVLATAIVGLAGALAPINSTEKGSVRSWVGAVALGVAAVGAARAFGGGIAPHYTHLGVGSLVVVAVAEEAFFRRLVFVWTQRCGSAAAVVVPAALFALIHVPIYGSGILGLDFAAGLLLGWQRLATGSWTAPAVTHVVANLLIVR